MIDWLKLEYFLIYLVLSMMGTICFLLILINLFLSQKYKPPPSELLLVVL